MTLPALTTSLDLVRRHLQAGGRAAYRFVPERTSTAVVRELWLRGDDVVMPTTVRDLGEVDDDGNVTGTVWNVEPAPAPDIASAYVLLGEHDEIGADPQGRWVPE